MRLLSLAALALPSFVYGQVLITELQPDTTTAGTDPDEWIEIHNTGNAAVNIGGYSLIEYAGGASYAFPAGTMLAANQVIIVTTRATAYAALAAMNGFAVTAAHYEMAIGGDDAAVPNLTVAMAGTFSLANTGGGVLLLDGMGAAVSTAEWGGGRAEVPGNPLNPEPSPPESMGRVNVTGSSDVDFVVLAVPTPGVGFAGVTPTPPILANETRAPAVVAYGDTFTVSATVTDGDGVFGAEVYLATATSSIGDAAGAYTAAMATNTSGDNYRVSGVVNTLVVFPEPAGFADRYVRYFVFALDNLAAGASSPPNAVTTANNAAYYWENVLPSTAVFGLDEVRVQGANEVPTYDGHSVRVEGVALTGREAFQGGTTNFFIAAQAGVDAIRVFDNDLIATNVQPGDVVRVTGKLGVFRGVRQIGRDERMGQPAVVGGEITVLVVGTAPVPILTLSVADLLAGGEVNESQLVEIANVMLVPNPTNGDPVPATWAGNTTLYVDDGTGTLPVRVSSFVDLAGTPTGPGAFDLRGIFTQFAPGGTGGYQLQPRGLADVIGQMPPVDGGVGDAGDMDGGPTVDTGVRPDAGLPDTGAGDTGGGVDTGTPPADAGSGGDGGGKKDTGVFGQDRDEGGCGCSSAREPKGSVLALVVLGLLGLRRRRA
jgi:MYXO-CTERM domain-containing protein